MSTPMKVVPRRNRSPTATWIRPVGSSSSTGSTQAQTPASSRLKCLSLSCTLLPFPAPTTAGRPMLWARFVFFYGSGKSYQRFVTFTR